MKCFIKCCGVNAKEVDKSVKFFTFPKDKAICDEWIAITGRRKTFDLHNARICSKHFSPDDYRDIENPSKRMRLIKHDAMPKVVMVHENQV